MKSALVVAVGALLGAAACDDGRPGALADCDGDLRGVWHDDAGHRFAVIGGGDWEWYPMADDRPDPATLPAGVFAAPAMIELEPMPDGEVAGTYTRRYERGAQVCPIHTVARLHDCHGSRVALDVRPPAPPVDFTTCAAIEAPVETWLLVRE